MSDLQSPQTSIDARWMARALALAENAIGLSDPNPRVGCVIVAKDGQVLGEGHTQAAGQAHAEVMALRAAAASGHRVEGASAYVTLEPCAHHGRTPPCCDSLIEARLARVVVAVGDPNPRVAGEGLARLRAAGVQVELGLMAEAARALNIGFMHRMRTGRPYVRLKTACSLDGRTALPDGSSQWITGPMARRDGQAWRRRAGAVLTGIGTVRADDPRLDVRDWPTARQPLRVVADRSLSLSPQARLLQIPGDVLIVHSETASSSRAAALRAAGAQLWQAEADADGQPSLRALIEELGRREINELHIEAGARLNGVLLREQLVDELLIYLAPKLLGPGLPMAALPTLSQVDDARPWQWLEVQSLDDVLRMRLQAPGHARVST
jgi:diaminohydroxyphosphoribosylaminopyrimidine deaminase/5-amino-6-(5-phosphoribosylamino)uracil reductase